MANKAKKKTQEQIDREELWSYYSSVATEPNKVMFNTQLKRILADQPTWSIKQIQAVLRYIVEHQGLEITSLAIVPYYYAECKSYYTWLNGIKTAVKEYNTQEEIRQVKRKEKKEVIFD